MHRLILILAAFAVFLIVSGCVQEEAVFSINPDGSGKVLYSYTIPSVDMASMMGAGAGGIDMKVKGDPYGDLKQAVMATLEDSEGVEAWSEVSYSLTEDQRIHFEGTAYFEDINKLSLVTGNLTEENRLNIVYQVQDGGKGGVIEIENVEPKGVEGGTGADEMPSMSEEQLKGAISAAKMQYQQSRMMLKGMFSDLSSSTVFNLPGKVGKSVNFENSGSGQVRLEINGEKLLNVMDSIMQDEAFLEEVVRSGQQMQDISDAIAPWEFNRMMFGESGPIMVRFDFEQGNLFDYRSEVKAARDNYEMMLSRLLLKDVGGAGGEVKGDDAEVSKEPELEPGYGGASQGRAFAERDSRAEVKSQDRDYTNSAVSQIRKGRKLEAEGDYEGAIRQYEIVIADEDAPSNYAARCFFETGKCYYQLGRYEKAREYFGMVLSEFPDEKMAVLRSRRKLRQIEEKAKEVQSNN